MNVPRLHSHRSHRSKVPNDQLPIDFGCADLGDCLALPFVGSHARDRALVDCKQLGFSLRAPTSTTGAGEPPRIRVLERVKGRTIQPPGPNRDKLGRSENRFRNGRAIKNPDEPPSAFVPTEDVRRAIMASSNSGVLGGSNGGDERKRSHPDGTDRWSRPMIYDADGALVTFGRMFNTTCIERNKMGSPVNARTSPGGEKEIVCAQHPAGLANSP